MRFSAALLLATAAAKSTGGIIEATPTFDLEFTPLFTLPEESPLSTPVPPTLLHPGTAPLCTKYYKVQPGDTCVLITFKINNAVTMEQFLTWNPAVGPNCDKLWVGYYVCIEAPILVMTEIPSLMVPNNIVVPTGGSTQSSNSNFTRPSVPGIPVVGPVLTPTVNTNPKHEVAQPATLVTIKKS